MRTLDHLFARRVSRRSAVQLFGAAPVLAHGALAAGPTALRSAHSAPPATTAAADRLFEAGQFVAADAAYARILAHDPHNVHALTQRGSIALLSNRLAQAQALLTKSLTLAPGNPLARALLALTLYRADDFAQAAKLGCEPPLLESFQGSTPYAIQGPAISRLPFLQTDPLLLIDVSVRPRPRSSGAIEPRIGGSVSGAFFQPFSLTIDTVGMRLWRAATLHFEGLSGLAPSYDDVTGVGPPLWCRAPRSRRSRQTARRRLPATALQVLHACWERPGQWCQRSLPGSVLHWRADQPRVRPAHCRDLQLPRHAALLERHSAVLGIRLLTVRAGLHSFLPA